MAERLGRWVNDGIHLPFQGYVAQIDQLANGRLKAPRRLTGLLGQRVDKATFLVVVERDLVQDLQIEIACQACERRESIGGATLDPWFRFLCRPGRSRRLWQRPPGGGRLAGLLFLAIANRVAPIDSSC